MRNRRPRMSKSNNQHETTSVGFTPSPLKCYSAAGVGGVSSI